MAYTGRVNLIKRGKSVHSGTILGGKMSSMCNGIWYAYDWTKGGEASEVTCKRCLKLLERTDEKGKLVIGKGKK